MPSEAPLTPMDRHGAVPDPQLGPGVGACRTRVTSSPSEIPYQAANGEEICGTSNYRGQVGIEGSRSVGPRSPSGVSAEA